MKLKDGLRGHVFDIEDPESLPDWLNKSGRNKERAIQELNDRYTIVATCKTCGQDLIEEEHLAHMMNHVPGKLRSMVRTVMAMSQEERDDVLGYVSELEKI